jgi:hypothetical protein
MTASVLSALSFVVWLLRRIHRERKWRGYFFDRQKVNGIRNLQL